MNRISPARDEHGTTMVSSLIGMALGTLILTGFMGFVGNANANVARAVERASTQAQLVTAANRIGRDVDEAVGITELTPTTLELDQGTALVRWSVTADGDLVVQRTEPRTTVWETVPEKTVARDVDPFVFALDPAAEHDGRLVHVELTAGRGQQISTAASVGR